MALTSTGASTGISAAPTSTSATGEEQPRGRTSAWERPALIGLLLLTVVLYTWNLTASGWANSFYSAAAQAGSESWSAWFFGSSDAANSITVDKPPASLWVMALSVRLLGLNSLAILIPQALMGVASVGVLYATVRRQFGAAAGLIAGAVLAVTPVAALMFRFNNPDALLTLLMTLGAWAILRAVGSASGRWFVLAGVFIGLGFLTKTLQVLLVVPFFGIAYLVAAPTTLRRRIRHALLGTAAMLVSAGWWVAIVELMPASMRPYIGGSQTNSFLELTFGYNGLGRLNGDETGSVGGGNGWGQTGLLRMFDGSAGGQVSWLLPSALILLVAGLVLRGRRPRTDQRRGAYLVWGGWLVVTMLVFSLMAGIFHEYYTIALAPAIGALVAMGATDAWERRTTPVGAITLASAAAAAAVWGFQLLSRTTAYPEWIRDAVLVVGSVAAVLLLTNRRLPARALAAVSGAALVAALAGPLAFSLTTVSEAHTGSIVLAGPADATGRAGGPGFGAAGGARGPGGAPFGGGRPMPQNLPPGGIPGQPGAQPGSPGRAGGLLDAATPSQAVVAALSQHADSYTWVAAAVGSQTAAGLQLGTQLPVMAIGGFNGSDPSPTLAQFQADVAEGRIHYFAAGGRGFGGMGQMGGSSASTEIGAWVEESFEPVTIDGSTFYDLTQPLAGQDATSQGTSNPAATT